MTAARRSVMWPLIIMVVGAIWLLMVAGAFPPAIGDILLRSWPALLVLFGFDVLIGRRKLRIGQFAVSMNWVGVIATVIMLMVLVWLAYEKRADVLRDEYVKTISQPVGAEITQVQLDVSLDRTTVTFHPSQAAELQAEFKGSEESSVTMNWTTDGTTGILRIAETHPNSIPSLENYGRGTLDIAVPASLYLALVQIDSSEGDTTVDLTGLQVDRVELTVGEGNLNVVIPQPISDQQVFTGILKASNGNLDIQVPSTVALRLDQSSGSGQPTYHYDPRQYDELRNGLRRVNVLAEEFRFILTIEVKDGAVVTVTDF
jgi:hypothetical protein